MKYGYARVSGARLLPRRLSKQCAVREGLPLSPRPNVGNARFPLMWITSGCIVTQDLTAF
jgi:hypothetical protein